MAELFPSGLRQDIRIILASQPQLSYAETLNRALDVELEMQPERTARNPDLAPFQVPAPSKPGMIGQKPKDKRKWENKEFANKRPWQGFREFVPGQFPPPSQGQSPSPSNQPRIPMCSKCGRMHSGVCKWRSNSCYTCGKVGHYSNSCPNRQKQSGSGEKQSASKKSQSMKDVSGFPQQPMFQLSMPQLQLPAPPNPQTQPSQQPPLHQRA